MARDFSKAFYDSKEWRAVREYVMARDKRMCVECGAVAEEVHHIIHLTEDNIGDLNITLNPDNLKCLCRECHFKEHKQDKYEGQLKAKGIEEYKYEFDENGYLIRKKLKDFD